MFPDWQAYEDGSLNSEERAQAEMILQTDRQARAELDALRAFRAVVRKAGQAEAVPTATLEQMLKSVAQTAQPSRKP
ncbi:anti-sigma factor, partial [Enterococcus faecium]